MIRVIEQAPRPRSDSEQWAGIGDEGEKEPHGPTTLYVRDGHLEVALDCGQHVKMFLQKDVFDGTIDTSCDLLHQKRAVKREGLK